MDEKDWLMILEESQTTNEHVRQGISKLSDSIKKIRRMLKRADM